MAFAFDGNASYLKEIFKQNNQYVGMSLMLRPTTRMMGAGGSDHMPFAQKKIPWIFFAAASTEDYHQPSDSVDKASEKLMKLIPRLGYLTAFSLANK